MLASNKSAALVALAIVTAMVGSGSAVLTQWSSLVDAGQPNELPVIAVGQERLKNTDPKEERVDIIGDSLPEGAIARLGTTRFRHPFWVSALAYTPDAKILASACWDGSVRLWDAETGKEIRRFQRETGRAPFTGVAITPDGKNLIAMETGEFIDVWDLSSGKERWQLKGGSGFALALSPDGKTVAKGLGGGNKTRQISLWNLETGQLIQTLGASNRHVPALAYSCDGKLLAAGDGYLIGHLERKTDACSVRLWDPGGGRQLHELQGHTGGVTAVAFSPVDKLLASASHDGTIRLWHTDGKFVRRIAVPEERSSEPEGLGQVRGVQVGGVLAVAFSPDGRRLASGGFDGMVHLWDVNSGKAVHSMAGHGREVASVVFSPDGKTLASGSRDHTIRQWDTASGKELKPREGHFGPVQSIALTPDGTLAAAACRDRTIHLWSLKTRQKLHVLRGHTGLIFSVAFSPDGRNLASASADHTIRLWDVANGRESRQPLAQNGAVYSVAFTPVDNMLLSLGADRTVRFWDWPAGKENRVIKTDKGFQMCVSRDGRIVGVAGIPSTLWEVSSGKELLRLGSFPQLALAPDGRVAMTHAPDGFIRLWNIATGEEQIAFPGPTHSAGWAGSDGLILSPDGRMLAARHKVGIGLWEIATGKLRRYLVGHQGSIVPFVFSPDGRTLLTGSEDTTMLVWDLARQHDTRPGRFTPGDLESLWRDIGGDDAECADRAIGALASRAGQSVPFLDKHLYPVNAPDPKRVSALVSDLDSGAFAVRDKAVRELRDMRELATPALKKALDSTQSLETRRRIEDLLAKQRSPLAAGSLLQSVRAVEVLERIDDSDVQKLLLRLTAGTPQARVTQEARDAMNRLKRPIAK